LRAAASKPLLRFLAAHAADPAEAARLRHLSSRAGKEEYAAHVVAAGRGAAELLQEMPSLSPPLGGLLELLPRLAPRYYTISSSPSLDRTTLHLTVKVLREPFRDAPHRTKLGVCSTQLEAAAAGRSVVAFVRRSSFRLPRDGATPVVMVGPGTGIAPFRAFLQEMRVAAAEGRGRTGPTRLYFGCRHARGDYLYEDELAAAVEGKLLGTLRCAFSRDGARKVYVQDLLREDGREVWSLLGCRGGHLYICGGTAMGREVVLALQRTAVEHGKLSEAEAAAFVSRMEGEGRLVKELWS